VHSASTARRSWCRRRWSVIRSVSRSGSGLRVMVGEVGELRLFKTLAECQGGGGETEETGHRCACGTLPAPTQHWRRMRARIRTRVAGGTKNKRGGGGGTAVSVPRRRLGRNQLNGRREGGGDGRLRPTRAASAGKTQL